MHFWKQTPFLSHFLYPSIRSGWGLFAVLILFYFVPISAQSHQACKADAKKLCANVQPGQGRIKACLGQHETELSAPCKTQMKRWQRVREACQADREKFCAQKRGADLKQCVKQNRSRFSENCKAAVKEARGN